VGEDSRLRLTELMMGVDTNAMAGPGFTDREISGLTSDSRRVEPGFLFAALPGHSADGCQFISDAVARGAVAVLAPDGTQIELPDSNGSGSAPVSVITDQNPRRLYARFAARFFDRQPRHIAAVTGTNGKTSVADFTRQLWTAAGHSAASVGTLGVITGAGRIGGSLTTPDPVDLHACLRDLAENGTDYVALEASSHGLDQYRLDGVRLTVAAFTNLTRDHLDYHQTMEAYLQAKMRLFTEVMGAGGVAVLNADDANFPALAKAAEQHRQRVIGYGKAGSDIRMEYLVPRADGMAMSLKVDGQNYDILLPLIGAFQAMNAACALGIVIGDGGKAEDAVRALARLRGVPGRIQFIGKHRGGAVYVDYAHTPDALSTLLNALRPHVSGRLLVVFGCGGNRDTGKRSAMGKVAAELADVVIVTDDNPRHEDASAIRRQVMDGCPYAQEIGDRGKAIAAAVDLVSDGDVLVVAGKGHETGQIVGDEVIPFDDVAVARDCLDGGSQ